MQLISSRTVPFLDAETLALGQGREALFRNDSGEFILYLSDGLTSLQEERIIRLQLREALIWLNETAQDHGSFWM